MILAIGFLSRPAPKPPAPMYLGGFVTAKTMNEYAANVGCPGLLFHDGSDTVGDAVRQVRRCLDKQRHPLGVDAVAPHTRIRQMGIN